MTTSPYTASLPATQSGTENTDVCSICGTGKPTKHKTHIDERLSWTGSIYAAHEVVTEWEITTWMCSNKDCRSLWQTEKQLGWKTV